MADLVNATPADPDANSYLTIADADAFAGADLGRAATKWEAADDATKAKALQRATVDIDEHLKRTESQYASDQALLFPRSSDRDADGQPIIPRQIRRACYEQAVYVLSNADSIDDAAMRRARGLVNFGDGGVSGQLSTDPTFGIMAPRAVKALEDVDAGAVVGEIIPT